jgi:hypothetical protein
MGRLFARRSARIYPLRRGEKHRVGCGSKKAPELYRELVDGVDKPTPYELDVIRRRWKQRGARDAIMRDWRFRREQKGSRRR